MRVRRRAYDHNLSIAGAGVGFYALIATFPGLRALLGLYGIVFNTTDWSRPLASLQGQVQPEAMQMMLALVRGLAESDPSRMGFGVASGALVTFWGASLALRALIRALNLAYGEDEKRSLARRHIVAMLLTAGAIAVVFCIGMVVMAPPVLGHRLPWPRLVQHMTISARWPVIGLMFWLSLLVFYRYGPSRTPARWSWLRWGASVATALWLAATGLLVWYVRGSSPFHRAYKNADLLVLVLAWFLVSAFCVLLGAEINAELERQTRRDTTVGPEAAAGQRGAVAANDLGMSAQ